MKTFAEFFAEAVVERRTYKVNCMGVGYSCEPLSIDKPRGTPTKTFQHLAKSKFLAKAYHHLKPSMSIHEFIRRNYPKCGLKFMEELSLR